MLLPHLELWRSQLEGSHSPLGEAENRGTFDKQLLRELNDLSNFLERIGFSSDLTVVQNDLYQLMTRGKPVGMGPTDKKCPSCGRSLP
ncbi:hypothetical protein QF019_000013 [Pseudomonas frederiksbergensis]